MTESQTTGEDLLRWVRQEVLALCEATEADPALANAALLTEGKQGAFARGRIYEAKGIRNAMAEVIRAKLQEQKT